MASTISPTSGFFEEKIISFCASKKFQIIVR
jgi:hypothetical protein